MFDIKVNEEWKFKKAMKELMNTKAARKYAEQPKVVDRNCRADDLSKTIHVHYSATWSSTWIKSKPEASQVETGK